MGGAIVAGDVGGTKTHLALYHVVDGAPHRVTDRIYATSRFPSLEELCKEFVSGAGTIEAACFGVPGPVIDGRAHASNVPWVIDQRAVSRAMRGAPVRLINDLGATAYGMRRLPDSDFAILQRGAAHDRESGNVAIIAAGTGLGEAALLAGEGGERGYRVIASEGGNADFAPRGAEQIELLRFLAGEFGQVSFERVLSGPGLFNIYRFLRRAMDGEEPRWLAERLASEDKAAVIGEVALAGREPRCIRALQIFVEIYGAEAGNLALKVLALGGVYLGGGIAPKVLPALSDGRFIDAFRDKGNMAPLLSSIDVRVSLNPAAALVGASYLAAAML